MRLAIERLRSELRSCSGTAACSGFPAALPELSRADTAPADELLRLASQAGIPPDRFLLPDDT